MRNADEKKLELVIRLLNMLKAAKGEPLINKQQEIRKWQQRGFHF